MNVKATIKVSALITALVVMYTAMFMIEAARHHVG